MIRRLPSYYNPWFLLPFMLWVLIAGILLLLFDREVLFSTVNTNHTPFLNFFMRWITELGSGGGIIAVLCLMLVFPACRHRWYLLSAVVCNAVPGVLVQVLKDVFNAPRPLEFFRSAPWIHIEEGWEQLYHRSFPSGHSAGAFALFCFLALIMPRKYAWLGLFFFMLALLVAYSRLYLGAHFFADVFAGSILGTTTALLCFALLRRFSDWPYTMGSRSRDTKTETA